MTSGYRNTGRWRAFAVLAVAYFMTVVALWALGAIALIALPAIFALVRRNEPSDSARKPTVGKPDAALAPAN